MSKSVGQNEMKKGKPRRGGPSNMTRAEKRKQKRQANQQQNGNSSSKTADTLLKATGGHGTDTRNLQTQKSAEKTLVLVAGQDPTLNVQLECIERSLQYVAMGICLRAMKLGWLAGITGSDQHPYYAFRYLLGALRTAASGTIPQLQQAPRYLWEIFYALKPKTERFKTGRVNYSQDIVDTLNEEDPPVQYPLGTLNEEFYLFWGLNLGAGGANGFFELVAPGSAYTAEFGAKAIQFLWQSFPNDGLNELIADPGDAAFMLHDTSAFAASYAEWGASFGSPSAPVTTIYNERVVQCPMLSKFAYYQFGETTWRGNIELRRSGGSACYIGPRCTELKKTDALRNKIPPLFFYYNFDQWVAAVALWMCRLQETFAEATLVTKPYPLTSQQFQILLRQTMLPYFNNDMAQDLRISSESSGDVMVDLFPFVVGPNGVSMSAASQGMRLPRAIMENLRCCRRISAHLKSRSTSEERSILDYVPIISRPPSQAQLSQFVYGDAIPLFAVELTEVPVNLIDASYMDGNTKKFLDLNGAQVAKYAMEHNNWVAGYASASTALLDAAAIEPGIPALNVNMVTDHVQYLAGIEAAPSPNVAQTEVIHKGKKVPVGIVPAPKNKQMKIRPQIGFGETSSNKLALKGDPRKEVTRRDSKKKLGYSLDVTKRVGAAPVGVSAYLGTNTSILQCSGTFPFDSPIWKYQQNFIKPQFFYYTPALSASIQMYKTNHFQTHSIQIASKNVQFAQFEDNGNSMSLLDQAMNLANLDVKTAVGASKSEMEVDFDSQQQKGAGGFFQSIGNAVGGFLDAF